VVHTHTHTAKYTNIVSYNIYKVVLKTIKILYFITHQSEINERFTNNDKTSSTSHYHVAHTNQQHFPLPCGTHKPAALPTAMWNTQTSSTSHHHVEHTNQQHFPLPCLTYKPAALPTAMWNI
jgi:hypothetical protein